MLYRSVGDTYVLRLELGEEVLTALTAFVEKQHIALGSVYGLGATDHVVVGLYNVSEQVYHKQEINGPMEITSLVGNISTKDGKPYLHLHINVADEQLNVRGGHLNECRISATCELFVTRLNGQVNRVVDPATGLNVYDL